VQTRLPWTFSRTGAAPIPAAPSLGQHTADILRAVGLDDETIRAATGKPHHPAGEPQSGPPA
jgi:crotonobetainyl-CoA:carnitine CoA-transferase CaiB-like acyl-CoA transferase